MIQFWAIGGALAALALWLVLRPLLARRERAGVSRRAANIAIHRDQLRELDADLAAGKIAPADHERARAELESRLLEDADAARTCRAAPRRAVAPPSWSASRSRPARSRSISSSAARARSIRALTRMP